MYVCRWNSPSSLCTYIILIRWQFKIHTVMTTIHTYWSSGPKKNIVENNAWERNNRNCYMSTNWVWDDRFLSCQSFFFFQLFDFIQQFWSKTKRTIRSHHHSLLLAVRTHRLSKFKMKYMCNFHPVILLDSFQIEHLWKGNDFLMKILLI